MCVHFAQHSCVYIPNLPRCTAVQYRAVLSSLKIQKSIAGTPPRHQFMVTMEPGIRQIKFFDTKLQIFESLNFIPKITNSRIEKPKKIFGVCRDYYGGQEIWEVGCQH